MPHVAILENQALVGRGLALIIEGQADNRVLHVSGEPATFRAFVEGHAQQLDLLILDIELNDPSYTGLDMAGELREQFPQVKIMFLTSYRRCEFIIPVFGRYEGYAFKGIHPNELRKAITEITTVGKGTYYDPAALQFYYECMQTQRPELSQALVDTLTLIASGHTNPEIAEALTTPHNPLTENSIRERRRKLRTLLQAKNSAHLIARAIKLGFIDPDQLS